MSMIDDKAPPFVGTAAGFGIWKCIKEESDNFYRRRWGRSVYKASKHGVRPNRRIDKAKGQVLRIWAIGLLGILGLHFFSVGRFITGSLRMLYGILMLGIGVIVSLGLRAEQDANPVRTFLVFALFAFLPSAMDLIMLCVGRFRDVFRGYVS